MSYELDWNQGYILSIVMADASLTPTEFRIESVIESDLVVLETLDPEEEHDGNIYTAGHSEVCYDVIQS